MLGVIVARAYCFAAVGRDHVIMWGGGFDATGIVTSAHGIHSLGWFIRFVVRFMVALGCIPHNSRVQKY